jgi:hypothetical protein
MELRPIPPTGRYGRLRITPFPVHRRQFRVRINGFAGQKAIQKVNPVRARNIAAAAVSHVKPSYLTDAENGSGSPSPER